MRGKPRAKGRRPTWNDLNEVQRRIHDALPDELRSLYLEQLPDITEAAPAARKKAKLIQERVALLEGMIDDLRKHQRHLQTLATQLENGADPETVDLRKELSPPVIPGVAIRYVRGVRGKTEEG